MNLFSVTKRVEDCLQQYEQTKSASLNLSYCQLVSLPPTLRQCSFISSLVLNENQNLTDISLLSEGFDGLRYIEFEENPKLYNLAPIVIPLLNRKITLSLNVETDTSSIGFLNEFYSVYGESGYTMHVGNASVFNYDVDEEDFYAYLLKKYALTIQLESIKRHIEIMPRGACNISICPF